MVSTQREGHAASYLTYYLLQQTIETQLAPTVRSGQLHLLEYDLYDNNDIKKAVTGLSRAVKGRPLYVIVDAIGSPSLRYKWHNIKSFLERLLAKVPDLHCWAVDYDLKFAPSDWQVQLFTRPIRFPKSVEMEFADFHPGIFMPYSQRGQHDTTPGPPVQWFHLPKHNHSRCIGDCDTCNELVVRFLQSLLAGASENPTTSLTTVTSTKRDTTSSSLRYRDVLIVKGRCDYIDLQKELKNAGIPVQVMRHYITEDMVSSNRDEVGIVSTDDLQGLERKVVVIVGETQPGEYCGALHCTSQLVFISQAGISTAEKLNGDKKSDRNSDEVCGMESDTNVEETQEKERRKGEASAACCKKKADDTEIQKNTNDKCYLFPFKIKLDLKEAATVTPPQPVVEPSCFRNDCETENVSNTSDDTLSSPIFNYHWQVRGCFSAAGGRLQKQGSDVDLQVPAGAIKVDTSVTVHAAVCANDVYIKHKLQLPSTETIVSPLAEFGAGPDFHFQKHVEITLPTCLPSDFDVNLLHVYCILSENPKGQVNKTKVQALEDSTQALDIQKAYFKVTENRQVQIMTSHFSGYLCTYCGICLDIGLEVYATHKCYNNTVQVSIMAQFWDKLNVKDYKQLKPELDSYRLVLRNTFQLKEVLKPSELQVDLIIDDEQKAKWQFKETPAPTQKFCLNCENIMCENSEDHTAAKYTNVGPFTFGWRLKEKKDDEEETPLTLDFYILVSHLKQGSTVPLWSTIQYQMNVQRRTEDNSAHNNMNIIIQNVENLHIAEQVQETEQRFA